jgi:N-acetyl-beta-hexosaminidase
MTSSKTKSQQTALLLAVLLLFIGCNNSVPKLTINLDTISEEMQFAKAEIEAAYAKWITGSESAPANAKVSISADANDPEIKEEGFKLIVDGNKIKVLANDAAGAMYGGLELAE